MCTPLAIATDLLILLVSPLPLDACASLDVLNLFDHLTCIVLLTWIVFCIFPFSLQWVLVISILFTSLSVCVIFILYCWFVLHYCITLLLHLYPYSLQWVPVYLSSPHPHVCLCLYFHCRKDDLFVYCCNIEHWTLTLTLLHVYSLLPQLLGTVAPVLTLILSSKLRQLGRFASYGGHWCFVDWLYDDCLL